jgi:hypothetical protein
MSNKKEALRCVNAAKDRPLMYPKQHAPDHCAARPYYHVEKERGTTRPY